MLGPIGECSEGAGSELPSVLSCYLPGTSLDLPLRLSLGGESRTPILVFCRYSGLESSTAKGALVSFVPPSLSTCSVREHEAGGRKRCNVNKHRQRRRAEDRLLILLWFVALFVRLFISEPEVAGAAVFHDQSISLTLRRTSGSKSQKGT